MLLTVFHCFHLFMPKSESLISLFAQSLFTKEQPLAIRSGCLWRKSEGSDLLFHKRIAISLTKTSDFLEKPISEFPTL